MRLHRRNLVLLNLSAPFGRPVTPGRPRSRRIRRERGRHAALDYRHHAIHTDATDPMAAHIPRSWRPAPSLQCGIRCDDARGFRFRNAGSGIVGARRTALDRRDCHGTHVGTVAAQPKRDKPVPELIVRIRFPSPALSGEIPGQRSALGSASAIGGGVEDHADHQPADTDQMRLQRPEFSKGR
jgi:hypothetical protein